MASQRLRVAASSSDEDMTLHLRDPTAAAAASNAAAAASADAAAVLASAAAAVASAAAERAAPADASVGAASAAAGAAAAAQAEAASVAAAAETVSTVTFGPADAPATPSSPGDAPHARPAPPASLAAFGRKWQCQGPGSGTRAEGPSLAALPDRRQRPLQPLQLVHPEHLTLRMRRRGLHNILAEAVALSKNG